MQSALDQILQFVHESADIAQSALGLTVLGLQLRRRRPTNPQSPQDRITPIEIKTSLFDLGDE